jgi:hypothetical protein
VKVYKDQGISGAKGRDKRPAFDALWKDACGRKFDIVMAWSVDRLGRSLQDLVDFLAELHALKIDLCLRQQGIDTTTPAGKALFGMMGVFAEFERSIIQERVRAGLERARREGKRLGRPPRLTRRCGNESRRPSRRLAGLECARSQLSPASMPRRSSRYRADIRRVFSVRLSIRVGVLLTGSASWGSHYIHRKRRERKSFRHRVRGLAGVRTLLRSEA